MPILLEKPINGVVEGNVRGVSSNSHLMQLMALDFHADYQVFAIDIFLFDGVIAGFVDHVGKTELVARLGTTVGELG